MTVQGIRQWDQLLNEFRSFGGIAENVIQRQGQFGLGLFPIEPGQRSELRVPQHLLVPVKQIVLLDGELRLKNTKSFPNGYDEWFRTYQANYSWGAEAQQKILEFECRLKALPMEILEQLTSLGLTKNRRKSRLSTYEIATRFIKTRQIWHSKKQVIMPILELVNHAPHGVTWDMGGDGIAIKGNFSEEILVNYSISDPLRRFMQYGFNCQEPAGFSLDLKFSHNDQLVVIDGGINNMPRMPCEVHTNNHKLLIRRPLLGLHSSPKIPRSIFKKSLSSYVEDADELFDKINHINRICVISLLDKLNNYNGVMIRQLRKAALDQLISLSCHVGSKDF